MKCTYCGRNTEKWHINWEGLKGYPMCEECHKTENTKSKHFIERKLNELKQG